MSDRGAPNVLFVANYPQGTGYAWRTIEQVYAAVAARLQADGGEARVIYRAESDGPVPAHAEDTALRVLQPGYRCDDDLLAVVREQPVDVCHLTDRPLASPFYGKLRRAGCDAVVVHERTSGARTIPRGPKGWLKRRLMRRASLTADRYVAVSDFVARRLVQSGCLPAGRVATILNGIDPARFDGLDAGYAASRLGLDPHVPLIFSAARANAYKGIPELIRAAARLRDAGRVANWIYCGAGPDLESFRAEVDRRSLADSFRCLGERDDVAPLLASSSIAVVPSTWEEAFGLTVVEAMAAGVPVVATRVGGIPEIVRDGETGRLVPPGDEEALAAAIAETLDEPEAAARRAEAARRDARTRFTVARVADELAVLLSGARRTVAA